MSTSAVRAVSTLSVTMRYLPPVMDGKALRPKWNGQALRKHREARGWSVEDLATALGASPGLVYKWENGESMPKADWLAAIVIVTNQPAIRFFTGIDEFQGRLKGEALITRHETPIDVDGKDTSSSYFSTGVGGDAIRPEAARAPEQRSPPALASPTSAPKHSRRSTKRRA